MGGLIVAGFVAILALTLALVLRGPQSSSPQPVAAAGASVVEPSPTEAPVPRAVTPSATPRHPAPTPTARPTARPTPAPTPRPISTPTTIALPKLSATVPGATSVRYFAIAGNTPNDLLNQMSKYAPAHCGGIQASACEISTWSVWDVSGWSDPYTGSCTVTTVRIKPAYTVWLPGWTKPSHVHPELVAWWKLVLKHIAWHEGHHINDENVLIPGLRKSLMGAPCSQAGAIQRAFMSRVEKGVAAFHAADAKWQLPPYYGP